MKKTLAIATLLALSSSLSFAEYKIVPTQFNSEIPTSGSNYDWSGAYVGLHMGYGKGKTKSPDPDFQTLKPKGMMGGIHAGYNYQFENDVVVGIEGQLSLSKIDKNAIDSQVGGSEYSSYYYSGKLKNMVSLNGKVGYAIDNFLPYITAGLTYGKADYNLGCDLQYGMSHPSRTCGGDSHTSASASKSSLGFNIGIGTEYRLTENLSLGAEYRYTKFKKANVNLFDPNSPSSTRREFKTNTSTLNFSVKYYFKQD